MIRHTIATEFTASRSKLVLEQAVASLQSGDLADAERLLRKHLLEQPQDSAALTKLAELAMACLRMAGFEIQSAEASAPLISAPVEKPRDDSFCGLFRAHCRRIDP